MLDIYLENCLILEVMRNGISQQECRHLKQIYWGTQTCLRFMYSWNSITVASANSELDQPGTVLVFNIETTGIFHKDQRIIEIALRDLSGGKNCTFETLINPEQSVPQYASAVTRIGTDLVCRSDIPRFSDVLPLASIHLMSPSSWEASSVGSS